MPCSPISTEESYVSSSHFNAAAADPGMPSELSSTDDPALIRAAVRRTHRAERLKSIVLIAPLFFFILIVFAAPIALLLTQAVDNREVGATLANTSRALAEWDGQALPNDQAYDALARDLGSSPYKDIAEVAKRVNYYQPGMRSLVIKSGRVLGKLDGVATAAELRKTDSRWNDIESWHALQHALPAYTDFYLLNSVDLVRTAEGSIVKRSASEAIYQDVIGRTFGISLTVTLICLVLAYPLAYLIATSSRRTANILLIFVLLPFWTSLLVRTTAWVVILQSAGPVNSVLAWLGFIDAAHPLALVHNRIGVLIAMVHILLPFMVLPIYSVMKGISPAYMRAALSLGAPPWKAFISIYIPLSMPGVSAGVLLVFIIALGYYITPALVGGPRDQMLSYFVEYFSNQATNWGMAAALSAILLVLVAVMYGVYCKMVGLDKLRMG